MNNHDAKRVVVLVDMDCFYCQVEVQHDQSLVGKPVAVVQYNNWRGGGIIAVNYEARAKGVGRHMRGDDAVQICPDINLVRVTELHGKADLSKYRVASQKVFEVLSEFSSCVQRASIDEAYIDLTSVVNEYISSNHSAITEADLPNTFVQGYSDQNSTESKCKSMMSWLLDVYTNELQDDYLLRLTIGAMMVEKLRESVFKKTGFRCSAGIANNKILAKLACGLHKPNQQTLLPPSSVSYLYKTIPIKKVRNLGGKLGSRVRREFNCEFMSELAAISLSDLQKKFDEKTSNFLYQISQGIDNEPVESRLISKSIGSCKSFPLGLKIKEDIQHWLNTLMNDIVEKLEADFIANKRKATLMTVSVRYTNKDSNLPTSQCGEVTSYNNNKLLDTAYSMLCCMTENQKSSNWRNSISFLGIAIGKFVEINLKSSIDNYFNKGVTKQQNDTPLGIPENIMPYVKSKSNEASKCNSITLGNAKLKSNESILLSNKPLTSIRHICNMKKNEITSNDTNHIKTMFAEMKNLCNTTVDSTATVNLNSIKENENKKQNKLNSFFSKKLEIISPSKNEIDDKLTTRALSPSMSFFSEKLKIISPSKNVQNDKVEKVTHSSNSFFSRKIEIVSASKDEIMSGSTSPLIETHATIESHEDTPMLLCERCNEMINFDQYDEHIDHHIALELSKSLNATGTIQPIITNKIQTNGIVPKKNKNKCGQKRRNNSKTSNSNHKKSCLSISSYFKPVINP